MARKDPLPVFCFHVQLDVKGVDHLFFRSVSGLKYEQEIVPVREGGQNVTTFQLPGAIKWANIVMKQGFTKDSNKGGLLEWRKEWLNRKGERSDGTITMLNTAMEKVVAFKFIRAWPVKWEVSELDASKNELSIETLEIAHEGITDVTNLGK